MVKKRKGGYCITKVCYLITLHLLSIIPSHPFTGLVAHSSPRSVWTGGGTSTGHSLVAGCGVWDVQLLT